MKFTSSVRCPRNKQKPILLLTHFSYRPGSAILGISRFLTSRFSQPPRSSQITIPNPNMYTLVYITSLHNTTCIHKKNTQHVHTEYPKWIVEEMQPMLPGDYISSGGWSSSSGIVERSKGSPEILSHLKNSKKDRKIIQYKEIKQNREIIESERN